MILSFDTPPPDYAEPDETARLYAEWQAVQAAAERRKSRERLFWIGLAVAALLVGRWIGALEAIHAMGTM